MSWKKITQYYEDPRDRYDDEYDYNEDDAYYEYDPVVPQKEQEKFEKSIQSLPIHLFKPDWYEHGQADPGEEGIFRCDLLPGWNFKGTHQISEYTRENFNKAISQITPCNCNFKQHPKVYAVPVSCRMVNPDKKSLDRAEINKILFNKQNFFKNFWQDLDKTKS